MLCGAIDIGLKIIVHYCIHVHDIGISSIQDIKAAVGHRNLWQHAIVYHSVASCGNRWIAWTDPSGIPADARAGFPDGDSMHRTFHGGDNIQSIISQYSTASGLHIALNRGKLLNFQWNPSGHSGHAGFPDGDPFTGFTGRIKRELVVQFPADELSPVFKRSRENKRPPTLRYGWVVYDQTGIWDYAMSRMKEYGVRPTRRLPENFAPEHGDYISELLDVLDILRDESGVFEATSEPVVAEAQFLPGGYRVNYFISAYTNYVRERDLPSQEEVEKLGSLLGLPGKPQWYLADNFDLRPRR
ncbi:hypothetical protein FISHEDRAFT_56900 [Fistulina hepatica ATCC 64428]|nr:hypothetical protein FISHEDRAFT_56900 [Fistulina hepatica ATCC 64428]